MGHKTRCYISIANSLSNLLTLAEKVPSGKLPRGLNEYLDLASQVYNGGLEQYVHNDYQYGLSAAIDYLRVIPSANTLVSSSKDLQDVVEYLEARLEMDEESESETDEELEAEIDRLEDLILNPQVHIDILARLNATAAVVTAKSLYPKHSWQFRADNQLQEDLKDLRSAAKRLSLLSKSGPPGPLSHAETVQRILRLGAEIKTIGQQLAVNLERFIKNGGAPSEEQGYL